MRLWLWPERLNIAIKKEKGKNFANFTQHKMAVHNPVAAPTQRDKAGWKGRQIFISVDFPTKEDKKKKRNMMKSQPQHNKDIV